MNEINRMKLHVVAMFRLRNEDFARSCVACQSVKHVPEVAPLRPLTWPDKPFERVHVDFAGPIQGTMVWPEVYPMLTTTTAKTIAVLRKIFAAYGLPKQLVSDNVPQFTSDEFAVFI